MCSPQEHIEHASAVLSQSVNTIDRFRRKTGGLVDTLGKMVRKQDYDSYTEMEVHAELVYAECLLLKVGRNCGVCCVICADVVVFVEFCW